MLPPHRINTILHARYELLDIVGQGGMGCIYKAADTRLPGRFCAIKEVHADPHSSQEDRAQLHDQFLIEASVLARLDHPNLPKDKIPYWDYEAAEIPYAPRDVAAASIMASALLELSTFDNVPNAAKYRSVGVQQLLSLSSPAYLAPAGKNGNFILMHAVGHLPGNIEIDVPLNYADYYYLEGLLRYKKICNSNTSKK